jgi:L-iditol 2-dehydrogenase
LTDGRGVDVAFEAAGAQETPDQCAGAVCRGGDVMIAGIPSNDKMAFTASTCRHKGLTIKLVRRMKHTYPRAIRLVEKGAVAVKPLVSHRLPLEQIEDAFSMVATYGDGVIRAVIQVADEPGV